jgi:short-subunit dehydrogenase
MKKKIIVIGASSGIGAELAKELLQEGNSVGLVARRKEKLEIVANSIQTGQAFIYSHDVTSFNEVPNLFQKIIQDLSGLDEIYFASGILERVGIDEFNTEKDLRMMNTNILGAIAWLNEAAKFFQAQAKGKIIGISSIAGDRGRIGNPVYNTSKAALNTYLEALRNRLSRKGITVVTVKPGFIDTDMTKGMSGLFWLISANEAAKIILSAVKKNKEIIYVPARWALVAFIIKNIPNFIFKRLSI